MSTADYAQRFLFDNTDIRGERVCLEQSLAEALNGHAYPASVRKLLGEMAAATLLLSTTLKFEGIISLQARSEGPVSLLLVECTEKREFRVIARWQDKAILQTGLQELMPKGQMAITIDPKKGQRYQGIVPMSDETLAGCLAGYFRQSEQLPTSFVLACDGIKASGLLLQALPASDKQDTEKHKEDWDRLNALTSTTSSEELLTLDNETLLYRLFHEEEVRLQEQETVCFQCTCSRERTGNALVGLGREEVDSILEEKGQINMDCQFCNTRYAFTTDDMASLFGDENTTHH